MVADGLKYLENALSRIFPGTSLQKCVTHLKCNMLSRVRHGDKREMADDLRDVFRTGDRHYTYTSPSLRSGALTKTSLIRKENLSDQEKEKNITLERKTKLRRRAPQTH